MIKFLSVPIIQAPMAGGVSTPKLAAAVSNAGGLGFLAAGYKTANEMKEEIQTIRKLTSFPFGVNVFVPSLDDNQTSKLSQYKKEIQKEADRLNCKINEPRFDDDEWNQKLSVLLKEKVPVISFTFGCPSPEIISNLKDSGSYIMITVTTPEEALIAKNAGADALCVQGIEAGGHRASFHNNPKKDEQYLLQDLLKMVKKLTILPLIAAGGIMNGRDVLDALNLGVTAVQMGTAFLLCPESGTNETYRQALKNPIFKQTAVTRAFTGRPARGLVNQFLTKYDQIAPAAYPHVHHMTKDFRKMAAQKNEPQLMSLWVGTGFKSIREVSASEVVKKIMIEINNLN
ncbi:nitronate monooxygenase [Bacillus sp. RG28]|uniref:Probable nitronate monooxygenase n=1 Tax=Gottfriedia endophytica TaxID=2820819 RepID=A0A940NX44_9BACI|nr:nitronate monooxygenase [Gottfriedia endophytica]MBP0726598.1 nitronate monooxygenase [Gottfriedia endophytica]